MIEHHVVVMQEEGRPFPLEPGGATIHHGRTMHYSRGNSTNAPRRGFIVNTRPAAMVEYERRNNYDHGKAVRSCNANFLIPTAALIRSCDLKFT